jgi:release factor glutamine methyltransferase
MYTTNMNISLYQQIKSFSEQLSPLYQNVPYQEQIIWWMVEAITNQSRTQLISSSNVLTIEQCEKLQVWVKQHVEHTMPLQYLIGSVPFGNCTIFVEPPLLIPRPETEEWVYSLSKQLQQLHNKNITILDLCTGSGAIACMLAKELSEAHIYAADIAKKAVVLARKNAAKNGITNITCIQSDLFNALKNKKFDLIVSNPPYISHEEWEKLDPMVREWEDYNALVAPDNGLFLIKKIIDQAPSYLTVSEMNNSALPQLVIEIGYKQGTIVQNLMKKYFAKTALFKDYAHNDRLVTGTL